LDLKGCRGQYLEAETVPLLPPIESGVCLPLLLETPALVGLDVQGQVLPYLVDTPAVGSAPLLQERGSYGEGEVKEIVSEEIKYDK
jgi:hypothetical protein